LKWEIYNSTFNDTPGEKSYSLNLSIARLGSTVMPKIASSELSNSFSDKIQNLL
jgi:hypothetical protein